MHEAKMMAELRHRLQGLAAEQGAVRIVRATVWIGTLAHLDESTLRSNWTEVVRGTEAEGCALVVVRSDDPTDPRALGVVLSEVEVDDAPPPPSSHGPASRGG